MVVLNSVPLWWTASSLGRYADRRIYRFFFVMTARFHPPIFLAAVLLSPTSAFADDSWKNQVEQCAQETDDRLLAQCIRRLVQAPTSPTCAESMPQQATPTAISPTLLSHQDSAANNQECLLGLCAYRPSYLIVRNSSTPNAWPSSAAAGHSVTTPVAGQPNELKFQLSFKSLLHQVEQEEGRRWQVWAAYTQQSHWQILNAAVSRPFRETNYEPELFITHRWSHSAPLRALGIGFSHQSNGQSNPLSRSWNRTYLQGEFAWPNWLLMAKVWKRWHEDAADDDNPGIENYLGRAELNLSWAADQEGKHSGSQLSLRLRHSLNAAMPHGSAQLEYSYPVRTGSKLRYFLQAFRGYGESMLDYNHLQTTLGFGIAAMDWFF